MPTRDLTATDNAGPRRGLPRGNGFDEDCYLEVALGSEFVYSPTRVGAIGHGTPVASIEGMNIARWVTSAPVVIVCLATSWVLGCSDASPTTSAGGGAGGAGGLIEETIVRGKVGGLRVADTSLDQFGGHRLIITSRLIDFQGTPQTQRTETLSECIYREFDDAERFNDSSAGVLSIVGGNFAFSREPTDGGYGVVIDYNDPPVLFGVGDTISVQLSGGVVPAFSATFDVPVELGAGFQELDMSTIRTDQDFVLEWPPLEVGREARLEILEDDDAFDATLGVERVTCVVDASAGRLTVPREFLARLPTPLRLHFSVAPRVHVSVAGWEIDVTVATEGHWDATGVSTVP